MSVYRESFLLSSSIGLSISILIKTGHQVWVGHFWHNDNFLNFLPLELLQYSRDNGNWREHVRHIVLP